MKNAGNPIGYLWLANQVHARFLGCTASFSMVALEAAGDYVTPGLASALHHGNDMVESQVLRGALGSAVLAGVQVAGVDIGPAEFDMLETLPHPDELQEPEHAGHPDTEADAVDLVVVFRQDFHLALEKQGDGALPRHDIDRLVAGVENKCVVHMLIPANDP